MATTGFAETALHLASRAGLPTSLACCAALLDAAHERGGPAAALELLGSANYMGSTALHVAAEKGEGDVCQLLARASFSALSAHSESHSQSQSQSQSSPLTALDNAGRTPLHAAVYWGQLSSAQGLLSGGADPDCRSSGGESPLALAERSGNDAMRALLLHNLATSLARSVASLRCELADESAAREAAEAAASRAEEAKHLALGKERLAAAQASACLEEAKGSAAAAAAAKEEASQAKMEARLAQAALSTAEDRLALAKVELSSAQGVTAQEAKAGAAARGAAAALTAELAAARRDAIAALEVARAAEAERDGVAEEAEGLRARCLAAEEALGRSEGECASLREGMEAARAESEELAAIAAEAEARRRSEGGARRMEVAAGSAARLVSTTGVPNSRGGIRRVGGSSCRPTHSEVDCRTGTLGSEVACPI